MRLEEEGEGAGIVSNTVCSGRSRCVDRIQAPVALILRVRVSSMNSVPDASAARKKTGTCKRIRGDDRVRCDSTRIPSFGWSTRRAMGTEIVLET